MKPVKQAAAFFLLLGLSTLCLAADGPLMNFPLSVMPDNPEILVLEINLAPGQESQPHRHNGHVFVYVLEGKINMQVAGEEMVTLSPGEMFYENPDNIHAVSQNASDTEPAKFLVHIIKTIGMPVSTPVN